MRVMVRAAYDSYTGYGNDAVDMVVWMTKMGLDVVPWPTRIMPGLPRGFTDLLTKSGVGAFDVAIGFAPPCDVIPEAFAGAARAAVGWSMWERTPLLRSDMVGHGWDDEDTRTRWWSRGPDSTSGRNRDWLDLMVVTCHDSVPAFKALDDGLPYAVVPNGIDPERWPVMDRAGADRPFTFASIGMLAGRKEPFKTLEAWRLAKALNPQFDARLVLKTATPGLHPAIEGAYPDVTVISEIWSTEQVRDWYGTVDCLVSTSRGEGNNKPAMEFMATGGPVMATNWLGHRNWLHPDTGYPLPGKLVVDRAGWADFHVDVQATAETFLEVWADQRTARRKGEIAARQIRATLSWEHVLARLFREIGSVL